MRLVALPGLTDARTTNMAPPSLRGLLPSAKLAAESTRRILAASVFAVNCVWALSFVRSEQSERSMSAGHYRRDLQSLGSRLRVLRTTEGLTLREVGEASNLSIAYLSDLERGKLKNPTLQALGSIARALGKQVDDLIGGLDSDDDSRVPAELNPALHAFRDTEQFREGVREEAARYSGSAKDLEAEWLRCLSRIDVYGSVPQSPGDYLFIWEAIRRALPRHV